MALINDRKARADETIFALASGTGRAGIAVIRLSGPACQTVCRELTTRDTPDARRAVQRRFIEPVTGQLIDKGFVLWFPGPSSFTGEDVLELQVHGSSAVLTELFEVLSSLPGLRPADAGEFSRRAFMNGKLDLVEAEGLADLIAAETRQQARQARRQMEGALGRLYRRWHDVLVGALAHIEAEIDFAPDEDVPDDLIAAVRPKLDQLDSEIRAHLRDGGRGELLRGGLEIAVIGPPNAGKSSLINLLSKRDVAIVTNVAGTTRDVLEVPLDLEGYPVKLIDMAGLRESGDVVEQLGVARARHRAEEADYRIALFDGAQWPRLHQETQSLIDDRTVVVMNKMDCVDRREEIDIGGHPALGISCLTGEGVEQLIKELVGVAKKSMAAGDAPTLTRSRHRSALNDVVDSLSRIRDDGHRLEMSLAAEELRIAMMAMGRITGRVGVEDLLDRIFGEFCIGK